MSESAPLPPDVPGEDRDPHLRLAIVVSIALLRDLNDHLRDHEGDDDDLMLRIGAVLAVLGRIREHLGDGDDGE
jgi:hypothetical protein